MYRLALSLLWFLCLVPYLQAQDPIAYYPFNGNARDESVNGHHGGVQGATLTADRFGNARSAYLFDGNDFIAVPHSPDLVFGRADNFTINAWVRICGPQKEFAGILVKGPTDTYYPGYQLVIRDNNKASSVISNNDGNWTGVQGRTAIDDGYWHFVSLVVTPLASTVRIYVDGRLDDIANNDIIEPDFLDEAHPLYIGKERNSTVFLKGAIDDIRIYDRALSETEIRELYLENGWTGGSGTSTITNVSVCANSAVTLTARDLLPPFRWSTGETSQSITVLGTGKYWVTGDVAAGCPRTDTFNILPDGALTVDAGSTLRICRDSTVKLVGSVGQGGGSYTYRWTPAQGLGSSTSATTTASPQQTTTYYLRVTDAMGCTGIDSVTVVVDIMPSGRAGSDVVICAGEQVEIGRAPAAGEGYSYRWISGEGISATDIPRPLVRPTVTGFYVLEIRNAIGCTMLDTMRVTVNPAPRADAGPDKRACTGESVRIGSNATGGSGPYRYSWTPVTGLSSATEAMPLASLAGTNRYIVTVTDANGCIGMDTVVVAINVLPVGGAGSDVAICAGEQVQIGTTPSGGEIYTYRWISGEGLVSTNVPRPLVRPTASGKYVVEITNEAGCTILDTVAVTVNSVPTVAAGPDARFCAGGTVRIGSNASGGNGPYSYSWSPSTGLSSAAEAMPLAGPTETTRYIVTVTDANGCSTVDTVMIVVDALPSGGAGADMIICPGEEVEIGTTPPAGSDYSYEWISGEGIGSTQTPRPLVRPSASGEYVVRIRNSAGCELLDTMLVQVSAPRVDPGPDMQLCEGDIVRIGSEATGGVGPYQYSWTPADGLSSTTEATPVANPTVATRYTVIVTDARGCRDTASVMVSPRISTLAVVNMLQAGELLLDPEPDHEFNAPICDSVMLRNLGDLPIEIGAIALARNYYFSIPPSQIPFLIPPHSERRLAICYLPQSSFDQFDTLLLGVDCGVRIPLALRANVLFVDDCNTPIAMRILEKPTHFRAQPPYPNPAGSGVTLLVERASPSLQPVPPEQCRLYSSEGIEVGSASYTSQSGWSRDGVDYERGRFEFATDHLPAGLYYVRIRSAEEIVSHPLIIAR